MLGHPATHSFNRAIAERYCEAVRDCGQEVVLRDLFALDFDPRLHADRLPGRPTNHLSGDVLRELGLLHGADVIVFIYPLWFGMPPAIIKGYVDRVLGEALTPHDIKNHIPDAILNSKRFAIFSTSATTRAWLEGQGQWQSLHQAFDAYLLSIFGMPDGGHTHFDAVVTRSIRSMQGRLCWRSKGKPMSCAARLWPSDTRSLRRTCSSTGGNEQPRVGDGEPPLLWAIGRNDGDRLAGARILQRVACDQQGRAWRQDRLQQRAESRREMSFRCLLRR